MSVKKEIKICDEDIEHFIDELGKTIYDLNKKHSNVMHRTNLGNAMTPYFRYAQKIKEKKEKSEMIEKTEVLSK